MKLSVSSYSFSQRLGTGEMTYLDCVSKAKEMGFDAIEFLNMKSETLEDQKKEARALRERAAEVGIEINAYTIGASLYNDSREQMDAEVERLKGQVEVAAELGAKLMRHDVCYTLSKTGNGRSFDLMLPFIADNARRVTEYAQTLGVKTCSENHGLIAQDSDRMERLYNAVNHENYGLLVDMGNFMCVDEDPAAAVSRVAPYAIHVHAKDMARRSKPLAGHRIETRGCNYLRPCALGEGDVPIEQCIRILLKANYDGYLSLEYEGAEDCIEGIEKGLKFLKNIL